ncbi:MAG: cupin domain-containing protein [Candidatus Tectimicrobiota bacterium]
MPVIYHQEVVPEPFKGGATYQTLVGDATGSTPLRIGIQVSPPGYTTPLHSHPYLEVITVLEGVGEAWMEGAEATVRLEPGVTLVLPADLPHWFRNTGVTPLKTYGVHSSPHRIVQVHAER